MKCFKKISLSCSFAKTCVHSPSIVLKSNRDKPTSYYERSEVVRSGLPALRNEGFCPNRTKPMCQAAKRAFGNWERLTLLGLKETSNTSQIVQNPCSHHHRRRHPDLCMHARCNKNTRGRCFDARVVWSGLGRIHGLCIGQEGEVEMKQEADRMNVWCG